MLPVEDAEISATSPKKQFVKAQGMKIIDVGHGQET